MAGTGHWERREGTWSERDVSPRSGSLVAVTRVSQWGMPPGRVELGIDDKDTVWSTVVKLVLGSECRRSEVGVDRHHMAMAQSLPWPIRDVKQDLN